MFERIKNLGTDIFEANKILFNKKADKYKIRICNANNLVVSAIREKDDLLIYPTQVSTGDIVADMYGNRFCISEVLKEPMFLENNKKEIVEISVLRLKTNNNLLDDILLSKYLVKNNPSIQSAIGDINGNNNIINVDLQVINNINLPIDLYWKKTRAELLYSFNNPDYKSFIDDVDISMKNTRPINENKYAKALGKITGYLRDIVTDVIAKYLANITKQ